MLSRSRSLKCQSRTKYISKINDMKKSFCSTTCISSLALILVFSTNLFSQITTTWKGGAPGMETDWYCAKNWSNYAVPDAFSNVVIPAVSTTSLSSPVIKAGKVEVNTLFLETTATFTVEEGAQLVVFDKAGSFLPSNFQPKGRLFLLDETAGTSAGANATATK